MNTITVPLAMQKIIGGALLLAVQSPHHVRLPVGLLLGRWREALQRQNFNYTERKNEPLGECQPLQFMAWTFVSQAWLEELKNPDAKMDYWGQALESGPYLFVIDLISPSLNPALTLRNVVHEVRKKRPLKGVAYIRNAGGQSHVYVLNLPPNPAF